MKKNLKILTILISLVILFITTSISSLVINDQYLFFTCLSISFLITFSFLVMIKKNNKAILGIPYKLFYSIVLAIFSTGVFYSYNVFLFSKNSPIENYVLEIDDISVLRKDNDIKVSYLFKENFNIFSANELKNYGLTFENQDKFSKKDFKIILNVSKGAFGTYILKKKIKVVKK